jgi:hypothetical protein
VLGNGRGKCRRRGSRVAWAEDGGACDKEKKELLWDVEVLLYLVGQKQELSSTSSSSSSSLLFFSLFFGL